MVEQQIEQDLKTALLGREALRVSTLRTLKSAILYQKVADNKRETGLGDDEVIAILAKEAKKRQESADLYLQGGDQTRAHQELAEKAVIDAYLPAQLSKEEVAALVDEVMAAGGLHDKAQLGQIIGQVKARAGAGADGGVIAAIVKEKLGL